MTMPAQHPPLALYIHFPWCERKCPYCDFNSHETARGGFAEDDYLDALIRDLEFELPRVTGRRIISMFFGGGTPSLISSQGMNRLLASLRSLLQLGPEAEITLEANPGSAEARRFRDYRRAGINRLSIGVQSFDDARLKSLGRIHTARQARRAIVMAHEAGFENINLDLMYGLPGQSPVAARQDLLTALECEVAHISRYQLTVEPNTVFYSQPPELPDEDLCWTMQEEGNALLQDRGYRQYEISAYAVEGRRCLHNLNYWEFGDYLGIGAGAHTKLTDVGTGSARRYARHRLPVQYMQAAGGASVIVREQEISGRELLLEFMMNTMRLSDGVPAALLAARSGIPMAVAERDLQKAEQRGLIARESCRLASTALGRRYLNDLLQIFLDSRDDP